MMNLNLIGRSGFVIRSRSVSLILLALLFASPVQAEIDFYQDVFPILKANCLSCHNTTTTEGGLNLESPEFVRTGGDTGPGVVAGMAAESLVFQASKHEGDYVMPPKNNKVSAVDLTPAELKILATWINEGAKNSVRKLDTIVWRPLPAGVHPIYSVDATRNGRWAACGRANQLAVYDLATRRLAEILVDDALASSQTGRSHQALVQSVAFSPDGTRLASGSFREVKIWHQSQPAVIGLKTVAIPELVALTLSPEGKQHLGADRQGTLHLIDVQSGSVIKTIPGVASTPVKLLQISADGKTVAILSDDPAISVWNLESGSQVASITPPSPGRLITWTSDGKSLAVAGDDHVIRVWLIPETTGAELAAPLELKGAAARLTSLQTTNNPARLLAACEDGQVHTWQLTDGKLSQSIKVAGPVTLAVSPDGNLLAAGCSDGVTRVFDLKSGKPTIELKDDIESVSRMAAVNWQLATQKLELDYQKKEVTRLTAANKSLDEVLKKSNETIATVNKVLPDKQKALTTASEAKQTAQAAVDEVAAKIAALAEGMKDAELDKQLQMLQPNLMKAAATEATAQKDLRGSENHLNDASNEVAIATAAQARNTEILNAANEATLSVQKLLDQATADLAAAKKTQAEQKRRPVAVAFSTDGQTIATVFDNGDQSVWSVVSGLPIAYLAGENAATSATISSAPTGVFITSLSTGQTTALHTNSHWTLERVLGGDAAPGLFADRVNALRFSPDGRTLAAGGGEPSRSGEITLWNVDTGNQIAAWRDRHRDAVLCLAFSPDGKSLASGAADKLVKVTDIATGQQTRLFEGHTHHAMGVAFRADGRVLASSGGDNAVLIWDMQTGERVRKIAGWNKEVTSANFVGATIDIVTSAGDNHVRVVNDLGAQVRSIPNLPEFMHSAASTADGMWFVGGGEDGVLRVWNATNGQELASFGTP